MAIDLMLCSVNVFIMPHPPQLNGCNTYTFVSNVNISIRPESSMFLEYGMICRERVNIQPPINGRPKVLPIFEARPVGCSFVRAFEQRYPAAMMRADVCLRY